MQKFSIDFAETGLLNNLVTDYLQQKDSVKQFYNYPPNLDSFEKVIEQRQNFPFYRSTLVSVLQQQYAKVASVKAIVKENITALKNENTFTVTTGHQLCIFTGPLYFLYKIISAINLAKSLKEKYPAYHFVPVYWMASEDHDFEEINHIHLFNKKIEWKAEAKGIAGDLPTDTIADVLKELKEILGKSENANQLEHLFENSYLFNSSLADAMRALINELFGKFGLVIIDGNNHELKKNFIPVMKEELLRQTSFDLVGNTSSELEKLQYKSQVNPRNINLFFIEEGLRERIILSADNNYEIANTSLKFSKETIVDSLHEFPEKFSPNVVLRPVYQETILPNIAYVGGPGELSYWLQYRSLFGHHKVHYPSLVLRNSVLILDTNAYKKLTTLGFELQDLFKPYDDLVKEYISKNTDANVDLTDSTKQIKNVFESILEKSIAIDPTLSGSIRAEQQKALNSVDLIDKKIISATKRKHETILNQIRGLTEKVFPEKTFQERYLNFIPYYLKYKDEFIDELVSQLESFDNKLTVLVD